MEAFLNESKRIINKAARNNKLVVFVGAGVSMNSGYPSWQDLIKDFAYGLDYDMRESSFDELLRIPQYYYNARKEKEYYDVIYNKFNIKSEPNNIHDLILELNPAHIITTNYDDLIERKANSKGMFYDVVAKDSDLAYSFNNKMIIKMHGDLKNKNIVLKEDDYMSYFNNFKLIQNYIKSLISTHVVLFVGYSVSDVNLKYIFQWVRDILKNNFQQAYLLECNSEKEFNQLEFEYYKNRGINVLYSKYSNFNSKSKEEQVNTLKLEGENDHEIKSTKADKLTIGQATVKILEEIIEESKIKGFNLDIVYNAFEPLKYLNVLRIQDIMRPLKNLTYEEVWYDFRNNILEINNKKLMEFFRGFNKNKLSYKEKFILEVLSKARIKKIKEYGNKVINSDGENAGKIDESKNIILDISKYNINIKYKDNIYLFNYKKLEEQVNKSLFSGIKGREEESLLDAYYLYKLGKFIDSYKLLKAISEYCISEKLYYFYFIAEFNAYYLGRIISFREGIYLDEGKVVKEEYEKMDLEKVYEKLPKESKKNSEVYKEISNFQFAYTQIDEVASKWKKIDKERDTIYCGIDLKDTPIYKLKSNMEEFHDFIVGNKLFVDNYSEVKVSFYNFIDCVLFSYTLDYKEEVEWVGVKGRTPKIFEFDRFIIHIMIEYLSCDEIEFLFNKYRIENLKVNKEDLEDLGKMSFNLFYALNNIKSIRDIKEKLEKYLYIIQYVNINEESFNSIVNYFTQSLDFSHNMITTKIIDSVKELIYKNKFSDVKYINDLLKCILKFIRYNSGYETYKLENIILFVLGNLSEVEDKIKDNLDFKILMEYVDLNRENDIYYRILIRLYFVVNENYKEKIFKLINEILNNKKKISWNEFVLYYWSVYEGIIEPNNSMERKIFDFVDMEVNEKEKNEKLGIHIEKSYSLSSLTYNILILLIINKILNKEHLKKYYKFNKCIEFLNENMPINIFEVNWINRFSENINRELSKKEEFKNKVKEYLIKNLDDTDTLKTYLKYYS
ncbi:SIR2 family protein [Clostridium perfringens]|uniref:SIR2 family protein n=1 Tax=Clostridium perfringens TaxID=1502 RepID=UPI0018E4CE05|nr:SIR2 family protein [Clostridium perfringens]EHK2304541.1 SIR2 family protein [Clostridium perfringens]MBI6082754.1 SIR2 family protein [Clostridium perfringens]MBI6101509.1 SIR2 family protein [Clostridium perfringens]MDJ8955563.1 SIR2 family protein [Clostridium perfringens]MDK0545548.1 SIR2 family protein [Clostridium perfringens]